MIRNIIFTVSISAILFASCGGSKDKDVAAGKNNDEQTAVADDKTIKDDKLYPFI